MNYIWIYCIIFLCITKTILYKKTCINTLFYVRNSLKEYMKILSLGDVFGKMWRRALSIELPKLIKKYSPDIVTANIDNLSSGKWAIEKHVLEMEELGIDVFFSGDHVYDNMKHIENYLNQEHSKLLRPANFYEQVYTPIPWVWARVFEKNWVRVLFVHLLGEAFMNFNVYSPFLKIDEIIWEFKWKYDELVVDFHVEATAEFYGLAHFLDWRASFVYGTHTHVQTNDDIVLPKWTWAMCDIGMCGALYWVIGADYDSVKNRFISWVTKWKIEQKLGAEYQVCGVVYEIKNWKTVWIEKVRINAQF